MTSELRTCCNKKIKLFLFTLSDKMPKLCFGFSPDLTSAQVKTLLFNANKKTSLYNHLNKVLKVNKIIFCSLNPTLTEMNAVTNSLNPTRPHLSYNE